MNSYFTLGIFGVGLFTVALLAYPPEIAQSQDSNYTRSAPKPIVDTVLTAPVVERISEKTEELKELTKGISNNTEVTLKQADKLNRTVNKLARQEAPEPKEKDTLLKITDTCYIPADTIFVSDTSLDGKTWWGKFFTMNKRLFDQCKIHRVRVRIDFPKRHGH